MYEWGLESQRIALTDSLRIGYGYIRHRGKGFNCGGSTVYRVPNKSPAVLDVTQNATGLHWLLGPEAMALIDIKGWPYGVENAAVLRLAACAS